MNLYDVVVRNELTGETITLAVTGSVAAEAQTQALITLFRTRGWRKACAQPPELVSPVSDVESEARAS